MRAFDVNRVHKRERAIWSATAAMVLGCSAYAGAQTVPNPVDWSGTTGSWLSGTNWSTGSVPSNANDDYATINNDGTAQIGDSDAAEGAFVILGQAPGQTGHVQMTGGTLTVGEMRIGGRETVPDGQGGAIANGGGTGTFVQSGGTVNVNFSTGTEPPVQSLYIGNAGLDTGNTADGSYLLTGGNLNVGIANNDSIVIGTGVGTQGSFVQQGGAVNCTGFITVGRRGANASYTMSDGTLTAGTTALSPARGDLYIGDGEDNASISGTTGIFNQTGGTVTSTLTTVVGRERGTGSYTIDGGSLTALTNLNVGVGGTGTFVQGNTTTNPNVVVTSTFSTSVGARGTSVGGTGTYTLNSGTLNIGSHTNDTFAIGNGIDAVGTFTQNGGTVNDAGGLQLGRNNSAGNNVYNLNAGSVSVGADMFIGGGNGQTSGAGTFTQAAGTTVTVANNVIVGGNSSKTLSSTTNGTYNMSGGSLTLTKSSSGAVFAVGNGLDSLGTINQSGGTINANANDSDVIDLGRNSGVGIYNLSGSGVLNTTLLRLNTDSRSQANLSGGSSNIGTLTLGSGTVNISGGTHAITGVVNTNSGTLYLSGGNVTIASMNLNSGSTLRFGAPMTIGAPVSFGNATIQVDAGTTAGLSGPFSSPKNGRSLTKTGPGTLMLSGDWTYDPTSPGTSHIIANEGSINLSGALNGPTNIDANATARVNINTSQNMQDLNATGGTIALAPGSGTIVNVNAVTAASNGIIDLADGKLISRATPAGTWTGSAYDGVSGLVQSARNGGSWDGTNGITSSSAASDPNPKLFSIGVVKVGDLHQGLGDSDTTTFAGETVHGSDTIAMYTYGGDANLDGKINIDDYGLIDSHVGQSGQVFGWHNGDFNYDGKINIDDYGIIDGNIGAQGDPIPTSAQPLAGLAQFDGISAVPEPGTIGLLAMVGAGLLARRRRR